jgi:hypothetical protein
MLRMAKTAEVIQLDDDPRSIRDPVKFNRLRVMIDEEAIRPTWGCPLYIAARPGGWLTSEHREAGDKYQQITIDHRGFQEIDPEEAIPEAREFLCRRAERTKARWLECIKTLGAGRSVVDELVLEELSLTCEKDKKIARDGLQLLANFFNTGGTKRERR